MSLLDTSTGTTLLLTETPAYVAERHEAWDKDEAPTNTRQRCSNGYSFVWSWNRTRKQYTKRFDKASLYAATQCFRCRQWGHLSSMCKYPPPQEEAGSSGNTETKNDTAARISALESEVKDTMDRVTRLEACLDSMSAGIDKALD